MVTFAAALVLVAVGLETVRTVRAEYVNEVDEVLSDSDRAAQKLAARTVEVMERVNQATKLVAFWHSHGNAPSLRALRAAAIIPEDAIQLVYTTDSGGFVTDTSGTTNLLNVADESFFKRHMQEPGLRSYVDQVWVSPVDAVWGIPMTLRLGAGSDFEGLIVAMVNPGALSVSYAQSEREDTVIGILGSDGVFRARSLGGKLSFGQRSDPDKLIERAKTVRASRMPFTSPLDGTSRFLSAVKVEGYPLFAVVAVDAQAALSSYYRTRNKVFAWALLVAAVTLAAAAFALGQAKRLDASRSRARRSEADFRATIEGSMDAVLVLQAVRNKNGSLVDMVVRDGNTLAATMMSLSNASLKGSRLGTALPGERIEALLRQFESVIRTQQPAQLELDASAPSLAGKRFHHQFVPLDDGAALISRDITDQTAAALVLQTLARTDELTGLANRRQFDDFAAAAIARAARSEATLALFFLDLDGFKLINDRHGHGAGDTVLIEVARRLSASCRTTDLVARPGGDEFAIISEAAGTIHEVEVLAERFVTALQKPIQIDGMQLMATASIGAALFDGTESIEALFSRADKAMYESKLAGRATYRIAETAGGFGTPLVH
jgi:diguanylate cyclase (GGDEF)-like protein